MSALAELQNQAIAGMTAPQTGEAIIRDIWPSVCANSAAGNFARACYRSIIFAPIGWLALAPLYFKKLLALLPGFGGMATRYRLTNRRLMICQGMNAIPTQEIPLNRIKDVRLVTDSNSEFFVSGTLEIIDTDGRVAMTLPGVPEPESVKLSIMQSVVAWGAVAN